MAHQQSATCMATGKMRWRERLLGRREFARGAGVRQELVSSSGRSSNQHTLNVTFMAGNLEPATAGFLGMGSGEVRDGGAPVVLRICSARNCRVVDVWRIGLWQKGTQQRSAGDKPGGRSGWSKEWRIWGTRHAVAWQAGSPRFSHTAKLTLFLRVSARPAPRHRAKHRHCQTVTEGFQSSQSTTPTSRAHTQSAPQHSTEVKVTLGEKEGTMGSVRGCNPPILRSHLSLRHSVVPCVVVFSLFFACDARSAPHC